MIIDKLNIGIDIVEVSRFQKISYNKNKNFYKKIFNKAEINYCLKFKDSYRHFAGKFAIKEATKKAISKRLNFLQIETSHKRNKPVIKIKDNSNYLFLVSLSHEPTMAVAVVISEQNAIK
jgi:holo-[acyl-carrier-protein] synthase